MPESPEEKQALEKLDEATQDVAWQEEQKEADREVSTMPVLMQRPFGPLTWFGHLRRFRRRKGDPVAEPLDDPDPTSEQGLRDVRSDGDRNP